jgi:hypothetical protein
LLATNPDFSFGKTKKQYKQRNPSKSETKIPISFFLPKTLSLFGKNTETSCKTTQGKTKTKRN